MNENVPFSWRLANALVSYVAYLGQFVCPVGLAVSIRTRELDLPVWKVVGAVAVLACISAGALACWRRYPYLLMGWLWYLGMLVPVIGLVQLGSQAMADRFTYLPQIGLCIALAWAATDVCRSLSYRRWLCGIVSALVLAVLMGCAWRQTSFWHDSETLWTHTLACTSQNSVAHNNLGNALAGRGQVDEAITHYQKALEIKPDYAEAHNNLGNALADCGQVDGPSPITKRPGNQARLRRSPLQPRDALVAADRSTRPSPITRRRWKSSPTTPRPTTTLPTPGWPRTD